MRRFPVFASVTQKRGFNCSVRSASTSPTRKPVCKHTCSTSRFASVRQPSTCSTSRFKRYSVVKKSVLSQQKERSDAQPQPAQPLQRNAPAPTSQTPKL